MLKVLEYNNIFIPPHTTIGQVIEELREEGGDFTEGLQESEDENKHDLYLLCDHIFAGINAMTVPTTVEFALCQGCKGYMPLGARCIHVTNCGPQRRDVLDLCQSKGPCKEYYVPPTVETILHLVTKKAGLPSEVTRHIATFIVPQANAYNLSQYHRDKSYYQLKQGAYEVEDRSIFKQMIPLLEYYY